jgi:hypothetical protein
MNIIPLILFLIFGTLIISGYINSYIKGIDLWNGINNITLRNIYIAMILLSTISGIYLIHFYTTSQIKHPTLLYSGLLFLLTFSTVWAWAPYYHEKIILLLVSIGPLLLLINNSIEFESSPKNIIALVACIILLVQTFGFDFMIWSHAVF